MQCDFETLLARIRTAPGDFPDVRSLCRASGLGTAALTPTFLEHVQLSPALFLRQARVEAASRLLIESTRRITHIAADVGFDSEPALHRHFLAHTGLAPAAYRAIRK